MAWDIPRRGLRIQAGNKTAGVSIDRSMNGRMICMKWKEEEGGASIITLYKVKR